MKIEKITGRIAQDLEYLKKFTATRRRLHQTSVHQGSERCRELSERNHGRNWSGGARG